MKYSRRSRLMRCSASRLLACLLCINTSALAGGPLVLLGPDGQTPVNYQNPNIVINVEGGNLGTLSNATADTLVTQAFALWNAVDSATVNLQLDQDPLRFDVNFENYQDYLPNLGTNVYKDDDNINPLIYDSNGEIIDAYLGAGQSDFTIGFAASIINITVDDSHFSEGYAVINGKDLQMSNSDLMLLIAHEIGHFLGLDHSQGDIDNRETEYGIPRICKSSVEDRYPLMYPFICRTKQALHSDDITAISALYPVADLDRRFGILQGFFLNTDGSPLPGANIWAENITTGNVYSIVSDYLTEGTGYYKLYLPAGNYTLHANSINPLFNGGSSIGPYASDSGDLSFQSPHPISPVAYHDAGGNDAVITISAGQNVSINFSSQGTDTIPQPLADNPASASASKNDSLGDIFFGASSVLNLLLGLFILLLRRLNRHFSGLPENG